MRHVRLSSTRLFPLALMLALALLTFWLERTVREDERHPSLRRHDPDYMVENFAVMAYNAQGVAESTLAARKMLHYPDDDSTELIAPRVVQTRPATARTTLSAERGELSQDGEETFLYDNVQLVREAYAGRPEMRIETSWLHIVRGRSLMRTDREVTIREASSLLTGQGLEYNSDTQQLVLHSRVRGHFEPRKAP